MPKKHVKPTSEELEANAQKALEEAEALKNKETPDEEPKPTPEVPEEEEVVEEKPEEEVVEEKEEPKKEEKPQVDYKKKFVESQREALTLHSKNKKITEAFDKASEIPEPTDEEMAKEYEDWDLLSAFEKKMARDNYVNTKRFVAIGEVTKEFKQLGVWQEKVNKFIDDPKTLADNPDLEGKEDDFKLFATKPTRVGVPMEDVVAAFLYTESKTVKPKSKGKMFETGLGGDSEKPKPKSDMLTIEEAKRLRLTDYKKYTELLKAGKISNEI